MDFCLPVLFFGTELEREWVPLHRLKIFQKASPDFRAEDPEFNHAYQQMKNTPLVESQVGDHGRAAGWRRNLENTMPGAWRVMLRRIRRKVSRWLCGHGV